MEEEVSDSVRLYGRDPWSDINHDSKIVPDTKNTDKTKSTTKSAEKESEVVEDKSAEEESEVVEDKSAEGESEVVGAKSVAQNLELDLTDVTSTLTIKAHNSLDIGNFLMYGGFILFGLSLLFAGEMTDGWICFVISSSMISFSLVMFVRSISYSSLSPDSIRLVNKK